MFLCFFKLDYLFLTRIEKTEEAIADANRALEINSQNGKAIEVKAEAHYSSGNFEQALLYFERGSRIYRTKTVVEGQKKTKRAIVNMLDSQGFVFDRVVVHLVIEEQKKKNGKGKSNSNREERLCRKGNKKMTLENLITEERRFLSSLRDLESLNIDIQVKLGNRRVLCEVK